MHGLGEIWTLKRKLMGFFFQKHLMFCSLWSTFFGPQNARFQELPPPGPLTVCFLGFIQYNKTLIACGFRKYENIFTHEYHILLGRYPRGFRQGGIWFLFHGTWFLSCVITCSDFFPLSNQINLFMVIDIWGIINWIHFHNSLTSMQ
jgi:hypothetical protein